MSKASLRDLQPAALAGKPILVRADLNVPMEDGRITDETRIRASLPTLRHLTHHHARPIVISHFGRPKGPDPSQSLRPVAARLGELLGRPVRFHGELVGPGARAAIDGLKDGEVLVLENTRFEPGDTKN